jgi:hypothetical protein
MAKRADHGAALVKSIRDGLPPGGELDEREVELYEGRHASEARRFSAPRHGPEVTAGQH